MITVLNLYILSKQGSNSRDPHFIFLSQNLCHLPIGRSTSNGELRQVHMQVHKITYLHMQYFLSLEQTEYSLPYVVLQKDFNHEFKICPSKFYMQNQNVNKKYPELSKWVLRGLQPPPLGIWKYRKRKRESITTHPPPRIENLTWALQSATKRISSSRFDKKTRRSTTSLRYSCSPNAIFRKLAIVEF